MRIRGRRHGRCRACAFRQALQGTAVYVTVRHHRLDPPCNKSSNTSDDDMAHMYTAPGCVDWRNLGSSARRRRRDACHPRHRPCGACTSAVFARRHVSGIVTAPNGRVCSTIVVLVPCWHPQRHHHFCRHHADQVCVFGFAADHPDAAVHTSFERAGARAVFPKPLRASDVQMIRDLVLVECKSGHLAPAR